ncbi:MAG: hypothetical protein L6R37_007152 [Teloschistes peruensis]|nr:MAG: hypothetical protein L6R37_007152 [Teloschistes peruensis]
MSNTRQSLSQASCWVACNLLELLLKDDVFRPTTPAFQQQQSSYWSNQQAETHPACRVLPKSPKEVAAAYLVAAFFHCNFAVKGGGHAAFAGASSIQQGINIDLQRLNSTGVNSNRNVTQVGAGNRWIDVYQYLTPQKLAVVGGRVSDIGVILANGKIVNANVNTNPDLYWALRGGGNNFGIVTRLDLETFPQGDMLGGVNVYPITANASLFEAYQDFVTNESQDLDAALILAFAYVQGTWIANNDYEYTKPIAKPPVFSKFFAVPTLSSTERITNITDLTVELTTYNPGGFRQTYLTATFENDARLQQTILDIFLEEMDPIKSLNGSIPALVMQPISKSVIAQFSKNGGNALGLANAKGPLMLINLAVMWSNAADDKKFYAATSRVIQRSISLAKKLGVYNRYIYQNYAAKGQEVFEGYGEENRKKLVRISEKYDPEGVFQKLQPGYFKLGRF